jgi:membrane fusion protein, heavy metal efflux system
MMKILKLFVAIGVICVLSCNNNHNASNEHGHGHDHEAGGLEPLAYTLYSNKTELFVEFKPLVVGSKSNFAAHFTILGDVFLPMTKGSVTLSLIVGDSGIRYTSDTISSPGIYRLGLVPQKAGKGKLVFDIKTDTYTDQIVIENVSVYADEKSALADQKDESTGDEIVYLKEQAWKVEFANTPVRATSFADIIKTSGQILPAPGDEMVITASASGILSFTKSKMIIGSLVNANASMFTISGGNLAENNLDTQYKEAKANYDRTKIEYERSKELVSDKIISEAVFLQAKGAYENAQIVLNSISKNYSNVGQTIRSGMSGFLKNIMVSEGQYVQAGTPLAVVSKNKKLVLQADVSQKYFNKLSTITSAHFKPVGMDQVYDTQKLMVHFYRSHLR